MSYLYRVINYIRTKTYEERPEVTGAVAALATYVMILVTGGYAQKHDWNTLVTATAMSLEGLLGLGIGLLCLKKSINNEKKLSTQTAT